MWRIKLAGGALVVLAGSAYGLQMSRQAQRRQDALIQICALLREVCHALRNHLPTELVWKQSIGTVPPRWAGSWRADGFHVGEALQKESAWLEAALLCVGRLPAEEACRQLSFSISRLERIRRQEEAHARRTQALAVPCSICLGLLVILWLF